MEDRFLLVLPRFFGSNKGESDLDRSRLFDAAACLEFSLRDEDFRSRDLDLLSRDLDLLSRDFDIRSRDLDLCL